MATFPSESNIVLTDGIVRSQSWLVDSDDMYLHVQLGKRIQILLVRAVVNYELIVILDAAGAVKGGVPNFRTIDEQ